jgi:hypothetical protein
MSGEEGFPEDVFADKLFPFISSPKILYRSSSKRASRWFWFTY